MVKEKNTITESFHQLIQKLNECDKNHRITNDTKIKSDHEYLSLQESAVLIKDLTNVNDNPHTQVDVSVNNEMKGMYYCLIENGALLLNKSLDREHAEYEIPHEKYSFSAEDKFKIKFSHNQLVIKLFFSCEDERENWLEYFFKARQSIYSYASLRQASFPIATLPLERKPLYENSVAPGSPKVPPKKSHKAQLQKMYPEVVPILARSKSAKDSHHITDFVDLSTLNLERSRQVFQQRLESTKPKHNVDDTNRKQQPIPFKKVKSMPNKSMVISPVHRSNFIPILKSPRGMFNDGAFGKH